ncbi:MAG: hypothetical protein AAB426_05500 [Myxococcota bacterium]
MRFDLLDVDELDVDDIGRAEEPDVAHDDLLNTEGAADLGDARCVVAAEQVLLLLKAQHRLHVASCDHTKATKPVYFDSQHLRQKRRRRRIDAACLHAEDGNSWLRSVRNRRAEREYGHWKNEDLSHCALRGRRHVNEDPRVPQKKRMGQGKKASAIPFDTRR